MKSYEKEAIGKNFFVFFALLQILLTLLFVELLHTKKQDYLQHLYSAMEVCSYSLECPEFTLDFVPKEKVRISRLLTDKTPHAYFPLKESQKFALHILYDQTHYIHDLKDIYLDLGLKYLFATIILILTSFFFTLYSLKPIRTALKINDDFVKDILHDFNTPISSMVLNIKMFREEHEDNLFIRRIQSAIDTIGVLQKNLKCFLHNSPSQKQQVDITTVVRSRTDFMQSLYPNIRFVFRSSDKKIVKFTNKEMLVRIIDNLLSNAAKYNRIDGTVLVKLNKEVLSIKDEGKGIKDTKKIFARYYKEHDTGVGLGLHIVKKLADELSIKLSIDSSTAGTIVTVDFSSVPHKASL